MKCCFGGEPEKGEAYKPGEVAKGAPATGVKRVSGSVKGDASVKKGLEELSKRSAIVRSSVSASKDFGGKSTDIMGDLTDDFNKIRDAEAKKKAETAVDPPAPDIAATSPPAK